METTRKEAIAIGDRYYLTGKPCKNGHHSKRATEDGSCLECRLTAQREARKAIREGLRASQ